MQHIETQPADLSWPLMLFITGALVGALVFQTPAARATDLYCQPAPLSASDARLANDGKARPAADASAALLPASVARKVTPHTRATMDPTPVSYVRCTRQPD